MFILYEFGFSKINSNTKGYIGSLHQKNGSANFGQIPISFCSFSATKICKKKF